MADLAPGEVPRPWPPGGAPPPGRDEVGRWGQDVRIRTGRARRAVVRHLVLRGPGAPQQTPCGRRRVRPRRDDNVAHHLRRDAARLLRPQGPGPGHAGQPRRGLAVVPHDASVLRPDLLRGVRPRPGSGLREGLQRLHGRGVVRGLRRSPHTAHHHPALGRRPGRRRGPSQRRAGLSRRLLLGDRPQPRPAFHPHRLLGPVLRGLPGHTDHRQHAHRLIVEDARAPRRTPRRPWPPR
ncbi:MAG: hypothetical protein CM1200mP26_29740 [Acidimicrobiales bacterium]|nr:MAG: hypothetical protein CM1200mP26_29740 [Acidimicrobiales bacterium]